jgi:hypothetical protein
MLSRLVGRALASKPLAQTFELSKSNIAALRRRWMSEGSEPLPKMDNRLAGPKGSGKLYPPQDGCLLSIQMSMINSIQFQAISRMRSRLLNKMVLLLAVMVPSASSETMSRFQDNHTIQILTHLPNRRYSTTVPSVPSAVILGAAALAMSYGFYMIGVTNKETR